MDKLKEFLTKLGLSDAQITSITSTDATVLDGVKVPEFVTAVVEQQKKVLQADESFLSIIKNNLRGEIIQPRERKALKLLEEYVTKEEFEALKPESRLDDLIALGIQKLQAAAKVPGNSDDKDKEIVKLRNDLKALGDKVNTYETVEIPKVKSEVARKLEAIEIEREILKHLGKKKLKLADADDALVLVKSEIDKRADVVRKDGKTVILQKGKDLQLFEDNTEVTLEKLVDSAVKAKSLEVESIQTPPRRVVETGDDKKSNLPGLNKAKGREQEMTKDK